MPHAHAHPSSFFAKVPELSGVLAAALCAALVEDIAFSVDLLMTTATEHFLNALINMENIKRYRNFRKNKSDIRVAPVPSI